MRFSILKKVLFLVVTAVHGDNNPGMVTGSTGTIIICPAVHREDKS